ncbi:MAG: EAL domain-containing protein [Tenericutes bacterium]|nr:EAL domain-containing protein [Mycoplasmatota bacterium]
MYLESIKRTILSIMNILENSCGSVLDLYNKNNIIFLSVLVVFAAILVVFIFFQSTQARHLAIKYSNNSILQYMKLFDNDSSFVLKTILNDNRGKDIATGLVNHYGITTKIDEMSNIDSAIAFVIDIISFPEICSYYGYDLGNKILNLMSEELNGLFEEECLVGRFTDTKFVILCTNCRIDTQSIDEYLIKFTQFLTSTYNVNGINIKLDKRIGYAVYPFDTAEPNELFNLSCIALTHCQKSNSMDITRFNLEMKKNMNYNRQIANKLGDALDNEIIEVFFQKGVNSKTNKTFLIEELSRWTDKDLGYIPPNIFFKIASDTNQLDRLDRYMVSKTMSAFSILKRESKNDNLKVTINITPDSLLSIDFFDFFISETKKNSLCESDIYIEISETTFIHNLESCVRNINKYKENGYLIAIDDFGTKYSSLSILESVNFDLIKIDAHFVQNIDKFGNQEIIRMIRRITTVGKKEVVGEGVETKLQSDTLKDLGCYIQQGYYHHRPERYIH